MSLLELKTVNETCKVAGESDLIIKDGPFWSVLKDLKNAFETGLLIDTFNNENYFNIKRMQSIKLK